MKWSIINFLKKDSYYNVFSDLIDKYIVVYNGIVACDLPKKSHIELFYDFQQDVFSYKQEPEYILPRQKRFFNLNENQELINKTILNNNAFILNKINEIKDNEYNFNHIFKAEILKYFDKYKNLPLYFVNYSFLDKDKVIKHYLYLAEKLDLLLNKSNDENKEMAIHLIDEIIEFIAYNAIIINEFIFKEKEFSKIFWFEFKEPELIENDKLNQFLERENIMWFYMIVKIN